ncbi:phenylalanine 4-monooxygenase [Biformimicrobium ophioploci]|uniref:Phenylalanine-4-hydroxylase n=1 Tax=Biformimicrobium ophioploci TaxID=3036711 RepID=A0ABQ6M1B5_9GAMM|nr:phenylalanine 4-monooxygenase [Microbulbifer sp. NKW57]GMG88136.1 phenylalanine 4-monooxygenase [Microbulbifer sp. NKW57]
MATSVMNANVSGGKTAEKGKLSKYVARTPDDSGEIHYSAVEHHTWERLITNQLKVVEGRACDEFIHGLDLLKLPIDRIPQLNEISAVLSRHTGWQVERVPALIGFETFFRLLANKRFPVATFIRTPEEFDYLQEPDIFHEIFGHCPMLTNQAFADFTQTYGELGLRASPKERAYLARLYWLTVEFGLIDTDAGLRIYGGGILSSPKETVYALSGEPVVKPFNAIDALRTPYRIDILQPIYYKLQDMQQLQELTRIDLMVLVHQAMELGLFPPMFEPKPQAKSA